MDVAQLLQELKMGGELDADPCCVIAALDQTRERLEAEDSAEKRLLILGDISELLALAPLALLFTEVHTDSRGVYLGLVSCLTRHAALPVCDTDSGALPAESYGDIPPKAQAVSTALLALSVRTRNAVENQTNPAVKSLVQALAPVLCVFSITHLQKLPWTSAASRRSASDLLTSVVGMTGSRSVEELLCGHEDKKGVLGPILDTLRPELTKPPVNFPPSV